MPNVRVKINLWAVAAGVLIGILSAATYVTLKKRAGWKGYF